MEISNRANLPTKFGNFIIQSFREIKQNTDSLHLNNTYSKAANLQEFNLQKSLQNHICYLEHLVIMTQDLGEIPLVRVHSECLTGDVLGSMKCDCGDELEIAMKKIAKEKGMIIYLRQEGRGIGLFNKVNAYNLQDNGYDTIEANEALGFENDNRDYDIVGEILSYFNVKKIRLLTNNPKKVELISKFVEVQRDSILATPNEHNKDYLRVKKQKLGHLL
ncbi:MAG: GTP cyclohydrolase II [Helicobacteraceae bacterium]|nr:GTP cyclohydrolase II [Helicobacteraceae bacterium]